LGTTRENGATETRETRNPRGGVSKRAKEIKALDRPKIGCNEHDRRVNRGRGKLEGDGVKNRLSIKERGVRASPKTIRKKEGCQEPHETLVASQAQGHKEKGRVSAYGTQDSSGEEGQKGEGRIAGHWQKNNHPAQREVGRTVRRGDCSGRGLKCGIKWEKMSPKGIR